jgi:hypothetical protein
MTDHGNPIRWYLDVAFVHDAEVGAHEAAVIEAVGKDPGDSGTGFGQRDLGFWFLSEDEAGFVPPQAWRGAHSPEAGRWARPDPAW